MNVLDVYPNHCWWFETRIPANIDRLRRAVAIQDETVRAAALNNIDNGRAFCLAGHAAFLELEPEIFDRIEVRYTPTTLGALLLKRRFEKWILPSGTIHFPPSSILQGVPKGLLGGGFKVAAPECGETVPLHQSTTDPSFSK